MVIPGDRYETRSFPGKVDVRLSLSSSGFGVVEWGEALPGLEFGGLPGTLALLGSPLWGTQMSFST